MPHAPASGCSGCGGCQKACPMPLSASPVSLRPAHTVLPLRRITGDEACFRNAHVLVSASCAPFACPDFHDRFLRKRVTLIACPGDRDVDHTALLSALLTHSSILTLTVVRMESDCCDGLEAAARAALRSCDKFIPWQVVTLDAAGNCKD